MNQEINDLAAEVGVQFFDYQVEALEAAVAMAATGKPLRRLLHFKTGAGKTITSLAQLRVWGHTEAVVIAPPSTQTSWEEWGRKMGVAVETMSHAMFRQPKTKLSRTKAVIADEFHLFGGHKGKGWKKFDTLAQHLKAPMVICSATPNYNDAERVYCIQHVLDPLSCRGGYLAFLHTHCNTAPNPFGQEPLVDEDQPFIHYKDAAGYLEALEQVDYLPDDLQYTINEVVYDFVVPWEYEVFGVNHRRQRVVASQMEDRHTRTDLALIDDEGRIHDHVFEILLDLAGNATTPLLVYADHATVAKALSRSLEVAKVKHGLVTGDTTKLGKDSHVAAFKQGDYDVLVGTASLATGTDGLDRVCDAMVILDDTDDDALRRQLIGRIMPRGGVGDASKKQVTRLRRA